MPIVQLFLTCSQSSIRVDFLLNFQQKYRIMMLWKWRNFLNVIWVIYYDEIWYWSWCDIHYNIQLHLQLLFLALLIKSGFRLPAFLTGDRYVCCPIHCCCSSGMCWNSQRYCRKTGYSVSLFRMEGFPHGKVNHQHIKHPDGFIFSFINSNLTTTSKFF